MSETIFRPSELSVRTVPGYWKQRTEIFGSDCVDLSHLSVLDSSAAAFLVQWSKSHGEDFRLTLHHAPAALRGLLRTFRLEQMFVLQDD